MRRIILSTISSILSGLGITMDMIEIRKGGKYTVYSNNGTEKPMKTVGEFVGYTILGEEGAVVFAVKDKSGKTTLRLIPVSNLYSIEFSEKDLITKKEKKEETEKTTYIS